MIWILDEETEARERRSHVRTMLMGNSQPLLTGPVFIGLGLISDFGLELIFVRTFGLPRSRKFVRILRLSWTRTKMCPNFANSAWGQKKIEKNLTDLYPTTPSSCFHWTVFKLTAALHTGRFCAIHRNLITFGKCVVIVQHCAEQSKDPNSTNEEFHLWHKDCMS
jgi:hypothetical protein